MKSQIGWASFRDINSAEGLEQYFDEERSINHSSFFHYTRLDIVNNILEHNEFWVSPVSGINDEADKRQFGTEEDQKRYFTLCFSTGINENLPLWYLYSGIDGKGARIGMSSATLTGLMRNPEYILCECKGGEKCEPEKVAHLSAEDVETFFGDVLYCRNYGEKCDLRYNTMRVMDFPASEFAKFETTHKGFTKGLIWYYEKETRLLLRLTDKGLRYIQAGKKYIIKLKFSGEIKKRFKVVIAPNVKREELYAALKDQESIKRFLFESSRVLCSEYAGDINMKLNRVCEGCPKRQKPNVTE